MILFKHAEALSSYISKQKLAGKTVSFVPTMGALHAGHLSLIKEAKAKADITVCSIFINPTQFNNPDDFKKYPHTTEHDLQKLLEEGCHLVFLPPVEEIYPPGFQAPAYDIGLLETLLEGKYRPGHFQGVCQVVDRLLQITEPDFLIMGQKDLQQCQVIARLLTITGKEQVSLVISPTVREADGLAMSSRNMRLTPEQRKTAPALYAALLKVRAEASLKPHQEIITEAILDLTSRGFRLDYLQVADAATLLPVSGTTASLVVLVAAYLDDVRLIDNLPLN
jgi:pantoate--beta-alanine ligase